MIDETEITFEEVLTAMFDSGASNALTAANEYHAGLTHEADRLAARAATIRREADRLRREAAKIRNIIKTKQPHWTPRSGELAAGKPTAETLARSRKHRHDPIRTLHDNGVLSDDHLRAAIRISYIFEQLTRLSNFRPRDLARAGMGGIGRKSGRKTVEYPAAVAAEHSLVYKPWSDACHASKSVDLPTIIDIVVFCSALRGYSIRHETLVQMLKEALDLYGTLRAEAELLGNED